MRCTLLKVMRCAIANLSMGIGFEDTYCSVHEAIMLTNEGERIGSKKLAAILSNVCADFQRAIYYALAGRGIVRAIEDLLKLRGKAFAIQRQSGGQMMPLINP